MDDWAAKYLEDWRVDFGKEPDAHHCITFLAHALTELKRLFSGTSDYQAVASSIAIAIKSNTTEGVLQCLQSLVFDAAVKSPLDPCDVAKVVLMLLRAERGLAQTADHEIASNVRERWNGPEMPSDQVEKSQSIKEWVCLNAFVAHLTRLNACPLEGYALRTLNQTFNSPGRAPSPDELDYHLPAAATWMDVLGKEIYIWSFTDVSVRSERTLFDRIKWISWKEGFASYSKSKSIQDAARLAAASAERRMSQLEEELS